MKKSLLSLICLSAFGAAAAMAAPLSLQKNQNARRLSATNASECFVNNKSFSKNVLNEGPRKTDSDLWMNWGYCGAPYNAFSLNEGVIKGAIMITKEVATQYAGAEMTSIQVPNPTNQKFQNPLAGNEVTVWVSEDLDGEPICSGKGVFGSAGFEYASIDLDNAYTLTADKAVYVGYTFDNPNPANYNNGLYSLVTDYSYPDSKHSAYLYSKFEGFDEEGYMVFGKEAKWDAVGDSFGNICLTVTLRGDMLPVDQAVFADYLLPSIVKPNTPFDFVFITANEGANKISDIDVTFNLEGQEPQVRNVKLNYGPLSYNESSLDTISFDCTRLGNNLPYTISVSAVNGKAIEDGDKIERYLLCIEKGFDRNVVVEEATGTWCGWCVVGYAGMEYMKENYSGKGFIGIALHNNDAMGVLQEDKCYEPFLQYVSGFPSAFMDRNWGYDIYPSPENLEYEFTEMSANPAFAKIDAELIAEEGSKDVTLITRTMFAEGEENANYGVAYTVVEDNVGPYVQSNYAAGSPEDYYGFEKEAEAVPLMFNDVARQCSHPLPFENSLPSTTEANTPYEFTTDIKLTGVSNLENYRIVAMVIDNTTGYILNACEVSPKNPSGVEAVNNAADFRAFGGKGTLSISNEVSANVYSTDGRIVAKNVNGCIMLPAGMYIVTSGNKSAKVIVR